MDARARGDSVALGGRELEPEGSDGVRRPSGPRHPKGADGARCARRRRPARRGVSPRNAKGPPRGPFRNEGGGPSRGPSLQTHLAGRAALFSRRASPAVPSALAGLTSGFGTGPGVTPPPRARPAGGARPPAPAQVLGSQVPHGAPSGPHSARGKLLSRGLPAPPRRGGEGLGPLVAPG